ncbi:MAG: ABC transporter substrate-binding protein [Desulfocapsa sp.]|nr:ABC transporter substrate-binding protein [Desulfocapsa sp.]
MLLRNLKKIIMMKYIYALLALLVCSFWSDPSALALGGPTEQLRPTLNVVIDILLDPSLKGSEYKVERRTKIMGHVTQVFDFREMSKRVVGREWKALSPEKQDNFQKIFTKLLENAYIGKLENYSGQEIQYIGERLKDDRAIVSTQIENNGQLIPVDYVMIKEGARWMVYDINIEGVSLVRNYMEQFKSILRRDKFDGLVKLLEEKNRTFE